MMRILTQILFVTMLGGVVVAKTGETSAKMADDSSAVPCAAGAADEDEGEEETCSLLQQNSHLRSAQKKAAILQEKADRLEMEAAMLEAAQTQTTKKTELASANSEPKKSTEEETPETKTVLLKKTDRIAKAGKSHKTEKTERAKDNAESEDFVKLARQAEEDSTTGAHGDDKSIPHEKIDPATGKHTESSSSSDPKVRKTVEKDVKPVNVVDEKTVDVVEEEPVNVIDDKVDQELELTGNVVTDPPAAADGGDETKAAHAKKSDGWWSKLKDKATEAKEKAKEDYARLKSEYAAKKEAAKEAPTPKDLPVAPSPAEVPEKPKQSSTNFWCTVAGGIVAFLAVGFAVFYMAKRR